MKYLINSTIIEINGVLNLDNTWRPFQLSGKSIRTDIQLYIENFKFYNGILTFDLKKIDKIYKRNNGILLVNSKWTKATLYNDDNVESANTLLLIFFYSYLVTRRTLLMHSSLIDYQGNGIMFLGPSGIGKTTQAELWNQFTGADILNGDRVFVRENPDGFYGYGSPWHGSSPYCMNAKVKLKALVTLEQASENSIRKLSGFDVLQRIMDQVFLPHWYPEGMTPCLDTLNDLLAQIPVYHLACRPDEDAVQLLKNELQI